VLLTVYAQGGYLGSATEERYYFYVAPLLWIAALAAYETGTIPRRTLWITGAVFAVAVAAVDITSDSAGGSYTFLAPVHVTLQHVVPAWLSELGHRSQILGTLSLRDARVVLALAGVVLTAAAWRYLSARTAALLLAGAVQLAITGWAFTALEGKVAGIQGRTGSGWASAGWVDRNVPRGTRVAWLDNQALIDPVRARDRQRDTTFYNDVVRRELLLPVLERPVQDVSLDGQPQRARSPSPPTRAWT